jgi:hypothetical protein
MTEAGRQAGMLAVVMAVVMAAALSAGCLIQVDHCTNAAAAFREARAEAQRIAGRSGNARQVNVLVFDPDDEKLVRIQVPMWLAKKVYRTAEGRDGEKGRARPMDGDGIEIDFDDGERDVARQLRRRVRLEDLEKAGPGILVEVEEDDGEQVLVWLR